MNSHSKTTFPLPKQTLLRYGLRPKKSFGQNFLCDEQLVAKIAKLVDRPGQVVEIGAGLGGLTHCLLEDGHRVTAIERDRDLLPVLRELFDEPLQTQQLQLLEADAKTADFLALLPADGGPRFILGNLPYNLTGLLLQKTVALASEISKAIFLVQLEVAQRLTAKVGSSEYGALTVFMNAAFSVQRAFQVRRGAFYPQPNVDSAVITLVPHEQIYPETDSFRGLVKAAFGTRRKTLRNSWRGIFDVDLPTLTDYASTAGIDLNARGETLSVDDFSRMSRLFDKT